MGFFFFKIREIYRETIFQNFLAERFLISAQRNLNAKRKEILYNFPCKIQSNAERTLVFEKK